MKEKVVVVWFRSDLRTHDHPAFAHATDYARNINAKVFPIFIFDSHLGRPLGAASKWWLHHSLLSLSKSIPLHLYKGRASDVFDQLIHQFDIQGIYWNRRYESEKIDHDKQIKQQFVIKGIQVQSCQGDLLLEPWKVSTKTGTPFQVFTPFWKFYQQNYSGPILLNYIPICFLDNDPDLFDKALSSLNLLPTIPWDKTIQQMWVVGEKEAQRKLDNFIKNRMHQYESNRDFPSHDGTSELSPYLAWGQISPRYIYKKCMDAIHQDYRLEKGGLKFLSELGWREFNHHLLYHFPKAITLPIKKEFQRFPWNDDQDQFKKWCQGMTGYPIVDAGMRQLWATGWMHNRVRMIVASFLVKHLLINWTQGESWFWDTLLDADLANNVFNWQWVAGSGFDAAPYFRIYNPILQGEKFDPEGVYVRKWIKGLPNNQKHIHTPWLDPSIQPYATPIVDHDQARKRALANYQKIKT